MKHLFLIIIFLSLLPSCAKKNKENPLIKARNSFYEKFSTKEIQDHKSILILPPANNAVNIDAPFYFLSTISYPIAEKGYYVFPVNLVNRLLEDEGLSDSHMLNKSSPFKIAKKFGADAILYTTIETWDAKYMALATIITAKLNYTLKSGKTGKTIWSTSQTVKYDSNQNLGQQNSLVGLLMAMAINAATDKLMEDSRHYDLVKSANIIALQSGYSSLPNGHRFIPYNQRIKK